MNFAEDVYKKCLSFDEAKNEQKNMLEEIEKLEKRINPKIGSKPKKTNKEKMEYVVKNAKDIYEMRNNIINTIKKEATEETEDEETEDEEIEEVKFDWLQRPKNELTDLIKNTDFKDFKKKSELTNDVKDSKAFLDDITSGKINNKKDVKIYIYIFRKSH